MKRRFFVMAAMVMSLYAANMTAYAAPETMPDGTVFDAEYYAETYPDVKAAFGNDKDALYNHYVTYGRNEGRKPCREEVKSPVEGAELVYFYETWGIAADTYRVEEYSNGIWVSRATEGSCICDPKYWILRTDYSDCLLDEDGNGIDDRDPYNSCGYTDLNHNCIADGVPTLPGYVPESEGAPFWTCRHGIVNGLAICQRSECEASRESMRNAVVIA